MFNQFNPQVSIDRLRKQREEIDNLINNYQQMPQQQPVNNIINTQQAQIPKNNMVEWRILNENEEVDNLYVQNETLFVGDKNMVKKSVDGKLEKWNIEKIYPIDKKDEKIKDLENKLKEMEDKLNEYTKFNKPVNEFEQSHVNDDGNVKPKPKTNIK